MAMARVTAQMVRSCITVCAGARHEMSHASRKLSRSLSEAGRDWHDEKYKQLSEVVGECVGALRSPIKELEECQHDLERLLKVVERWDDASVRG